KCQRRARCGRRELRPKVQCAAAVEHGEWRSPPRPTERATVTTSESRNGHTTGAPLSKKNPAFSSGLRSGPNWASLEPAGAPERVTEPSGAGSESQRWSEEQVPARPWAAPAFLRLDQCETDDPLEMQNRASLADCRRIDPYAEVFPDPLGGTPRGLIGAGLVLTRGHRLSAAVAPKRRVADEPR